MLDTVTRTRSSWILTWKKEEAMLINKSKYVYVYLFNFHLCLASNLSYLNWFKIIIFARYPDEDENCNLFRKEKESERKLVTLWTTPLFLYFFFFYFQRKKNKPRTSIKERTKKGEEQKKEREKKRKITFSFEGRIDSFSFLRHSSWKFEPICRGDFSS